MKDNDPLLDGQTIEETTEYETWSWWTSPPDRDKWIPRLPISMTEAEAQQYKKEMFFRKQDRHSLLRKYKKIIEISTYEIVDRIPAETNEDIPE